MVAGMMPRVKPGLIKHRLPRTKATCKICGKPIRNNDRYCMKCQEFINRQQAREERKTK